jgi:hypothetical protein
MTVIAGLSPLKQLQQARLHKRAMKASLRGNQGKLGTLLRGFALVRAHSQ